MTRKPRLGLSLALVAGLAITSGSVAAAEETRPATQVSLTLYVSPEGNDTWSGKLPAPNVERTDGPLATLQGARDRIRKEKAASTLAHGATVLVRGGFYFLKEPLSFSPEDSGTRGGPITYAAYPGEVPVVSGGVPLKGWQRREGGRWQVHLPEVQHGEWSFTQLFVNGERRYRPRLPKDGYYRIAKEGPSPGKDRAPDSFQFKPGQLDPAWPDLQDVEVLVFHSWTMDRLRIKAVDAARRLVTFTAPTLGNAWFFDLRAGKRFLIENVAAALEKPGQWHLDRNAGVLTYLAMTSEKPDTAEVIAPRLERLLILRGDAAAGRPVEYLVFRGLTLAHSNWTTPPEGWRCGQSESGLWGALSAVAARHCVFDACKIAHVGTYAMDFGEGCKHNRIENCELTDLAAGGIKIGEMGIRDDEERLTSHNVVRNSLIAHGGRMHAAGMGVWIGHSPFNLVEHNEICDFYQTGISAGWSWGYGRSQAHDNTIAYNRIHDIGQGVTDDMGGIYTLGVSTGTVLHHNLIHDVACDAYGGRGIYFDEGTSEILAENNVVYHTDAGAFMQHYGRDNRVLNNIFALARGGQLDRLREENHRSFTFKHNIVCYDDAGTLLWENWGNNQYVMDENLYWKAGSLPVLFGNMTLAEWQKKGHDRNSLIADPLFVDPASGDFTLKPGSPALRIGFKPFDLKTAGRVPSPKQEEPIAPRAFPPKAQAEPISEDFDSVPVGERAPGTVTTEENDRATVRVTDETAAGGKHSIKFIDIPGQKQNFNPHFYYQTEFTSGIMEGHFDVRLEAGFQLCYEWRDVTVFYKCGPQLRLFPDGTLNASGKNLMKVPLGQWVGIDIVCGLGKQATKTYDVAVRLPGEAQPRRFTGLSCGPGFNRVHWLIFTAEGTENGTCYLDNIRLAPRSEAR